MAYAFFSLTAPLSIPVSGSIRAAAAGTVLCSFVTGGEGASCRLQFLFVDIWFDSDGWLW